MHGHGTGDLLEAVMEKLYDLHVPGTETDYENIANEFCAQFAAGLNAAPPTVKF